MYSASLLHLLSSGFLTPLAKIGTGLPWRLGPWLQNYDQRCKWTDAFYPDCFILHPPPFLFLPIDYAEMKWNEMEATRKAKFYAAVV